MIKKLIAAVVVLSFGVAAQAATLASEFTGATHYVDAAAEAGGDGSQAKPYKTIQAAIDASSSLDKIVIAAGVYECPETPKVQPGTTYKTHLLIADKRIRLMGAGREKTIVRGRWDATGDHGVGENAARCLTIVGGTAANCLIEGINFEDGATVSGQSCGGVFASPTGGCYVDCVFRRCSADTGIGATGGASQKYIRCLFDGNYCSGDRGGSAIGGSIAGCYNCVFMRNEASAAVGHVIQKGYTPPYVNCTFVANTYNAIPDNAYYGVHYNNVFSDCGKKYSGWGEASYAFTRQAVSCDHCVTDVGAGTVGNSEALQNYNTTTTPNIQTNMMYALFSPLTFDFRPIVNSPMVATGKPDYAGANGTKISWVPEEYRDTDYEGNPRLTNGTICRGAVEAVATSDCAPTEIGTDTILPDYPGGDIMAGRHLYFRAPSYPAAFYVKYHCPTNDSYEPYRFSTPYTGVSNGYRAPDEKGGIWYVPKKFSTVTINWATRAGATGVGSVVGNKAADIKWVDASLQNYTEADGSAEKPFKTIQEGVDSVAVGGIVKVRPGTYDEGYVDTKGHTRVKITKSVHIVGVEGPEKTIVVGAINSEEEKTGDNAVRGFYNSAGSSDYVSIVGFTITGCSTLRATKSAIWSEWGGGAVYAQNRCCQVVDCIISNNWAFASPGVYNGWSQRCRFIDNHQDVPAGISASRSAATDSALVSSCLFSYDANDGQVAGIGNSSVGVGCTVRFRKSNVRAFDDSSNVRVNCIVIDSWTGPGSGTPVFSGSICWNDGVGTGMKANPAVRVIDPLLANPEGGDFRPLVNSPAIVDGGSVDSDYFASCSVGTLENLNPVVNGRPIVGCCGETVVVCNVGEGVVPSGRVGVKPGESIVLRPAKDRPVLGYTVGSSTEVVPSRGKDEGYSYVWTASDAQTAVTPVSIVYGTNWYVNATSGSDETGDGWTPETANKTFAKVFSHDVEAGDVVHAAEGDYDEGEMLNVKKGSAVFWNTARADIYSRVKVPDGVTLKADGARERTTIWGRWHSATQRNGPVYNDTTVVYPATPNNALRGVALGHNSVLDGFTVKNGCGTGSSGNLLDDNVGGGIIGFRVTDAKPSYVRNCTITGSGERNGAVFGCLLENCYLYDNQCTSDGSQCARSRLVNCFVYNDNSSAVVSHDGIYGSTIIETVGNYQVSEFNSSSAVVNSIIMCKLYQSQAAYTVGNWHNCVVQMDRTDRLILSESCTNIRTNTLAECLLDANDWYAPKKGSPAIDWGDASLMAAVGGVPQTDYRGGQRVYNGTVDVGCNEYDWRGDYAADLVSPDIVVTEASPEVVETDGKNVSIPDGATVKLDWPGTSGSYEARFAISGGTLTVTENGKEPVAYTEGGSYVIAEPTADTKLVFTYAGTGSATLLPFLGAYEAKIGTTPYTNFADAYAAVSGSDEITLLKNVTWGPTIDAALKTVSVDKGDFTLTIAPASVTAFNAKGYVCKFDDTTLKVGLPFAGGAGTAASPWEIGDWETLDLYRQGVLAKTYTTEHVQQTDDIDFTGKSAWLGIGDLFTKAYSDTKVCFVGTYDGAGHRITNVKFVNNKYTGFFQRVGNGTTPGCVKNLTVHTLGFETPEATAEYGGAIVAAGLHNGSIIGVTAEGTFGSETYPISGNSAGIVCRFAAGTIESCTNKATIWASSSKIGGIANIAQTDDAGSGTMFEGPNVIAACVNQGAIRHKGEAPADGGFAGILGYSAAKVSATISGCVNEGEITSTSATTLLGQIVGRYIQGVLVIDSGCQVRTDIFALGDVSPKYEVPRPDCLDFATVENGVATLVSTNDLVKGGSYKVMAPLAAYNLQFTKNDVPRSDPIRTISFDRSLYAGFEPTVTPAVGVKVTGPAIEGDVLTYTVRRRMGTLMILQ